ncbi:recombinase RecA [Thermococcus sp. M39]|uniref:RAD55 family ATPase n=1 Tax=unclassified Thermococcus TaxID=2627626 RepID=UPI00143A35D0|nr:MULTISPECIES: RAD55 family ATPase [unclassified Thermococcus]NJE08210.1 recombinase RecA [Thermococcus sp. M39]NJE11703.1 recombinase RecA [Thermococcus sp. LS2]
MDQSLFEVYEEVEKHVERVSTGIIDDLIMGGIPKGSVILLIGDPKSGKTTFISQFIHTQLAMGYPTIGILVDISKYEFVSNALSFGWDFMPYLEDTFFVLDAYSQRLRGTPRFTFDEAVVTDITDTTQLIDAIKDITLKILSQKNPPMITGVISSLTPIFFETDKKQIYKFLEDLKEFAHRHKQVWILEMNSGIEEPHVEMMVKAIVDGIIEMRLIEENMTLRRYLRVYGMRRTKHVLSWVPYEITESGIKLQL